MPLPAAKSKAAIVRSLICSSLSVNAASKACPLIIVSSPNTLTCCNAEACLSNAWDVCPNAVASCFSACSCSPAKAIACLNPLSNPLAPKYASAAVPTCLASLLKLPVSLLTLCVAFCVPLVLTS